MQTRLAICRWIAMSTLLTTASPGFAVPSSDLVWRAGDVWQLQIDVPHKPSFALYVINAGVANVDNSGCWIFNFLPNSGVPSDLKSPYRVFVDQKTGFPVRVFRFDNNKIIALEKADLASFITDAPEGMPLEFLGAVDLAKTNSNSGWQIEVRRQEQGNHVLVEMTVTNNGVEELKVRQKWVEGESWWSEYERFVKGEKVLQARTLKRIVPAKATTQKKDVQESPTQTFSERFYLRMDPKLRVPLGVQAIDPPLDNLLDRLRKTTGLTLTLADNLTHHDPKFGDLQLAKATAWNIMEMISERDIDNGRWEKTEDGYRLTGVSKALRPSTRPSFWLVATAGCGAALVLAGGVLVLRGRRTKLNSG